MANVLEIAQSVTDDVGVRPITNLYGNSEPHARILLFQLNESGRSQVLKRNAFNQGWSVLTREYLFNTAPNVDEYAFPDDYIGLVSETLWDRSNRRFGEGPLTPSQWQYQKSGRVGTTDLNPRFRIRRKTTGLGKALYLDPVPTDVRTLAIEYISRNWLSDSTGTRFYDTIESDSDIPLIDFQLLIMDLNWRFRSSRGLSYAIELAKFEQREAELFGQDAGTTIINLDSHNGYSLEPNIAETGFGFE